MNSFPNSWEDAVIDFDCEGSLQSFPCKLKKIRPLPLYLTTALALLVSINQIQIQIDSSDSDMEPALRLGK